MASRWLSPLLELTASSDRSVSALSSTGLLSPDPCPSEPTASSGSLPISPSTPWAAQQLSLLRSPKPYHTPHLDHQRLPKTPPEGPACKERHHPCNRRPIPCLRVFTPSSRPLHAVPFQQQSLKRAPSHRSRTPTGAADNSTAPQPKRSPCSIQNREAPQIHAFLSRRPLHTGFCSLFLSRGAEDPAHESKATSPLIQIDIFQLACLAGAPEL